MCLVLLALNQHKDYPVIIAANRDEFYQRPAQHMHWWKSDAILAGKDIEAGGTWLALAHNANFAVVTNYREVPQQQGSVSRGQLPLLWHKAQTTPESFYTHLNMAQFAGFNLLFGNLRTALFHASNRSQTLTKLTTGFHGLSNALLNSAWPKIDDAKPIMHLLCQREFQVEPWFTLLNDKTNAEDNRLPNTGVGLMQERLLSSRFIHSEHYGTRCSTVIAMNNQQHIYVWERSFDHNALALSTVSFNFR